jgi:hypothetical protein
MTKPADKLERFKISAASSGINDAKVISAGPRDPGDILGEIIAKANPYQVGRKVISARDKLLDHHLDRQRFTLRFLSLVVLPSTFLVGVVAKDEKIRTSCFGMVSLIVGALIQESGSQRAPRVEEENEENKE